MLLVVNFGTHVVGTTWLSNLVLILHTFLQFNCLQHFQYFKEKRSRSNSLGPLAIINVVFDIALESYNCGYSNSNSTWTN